MAMTRTEATALAGVALLHVALFAWLSLALPESADLDRPPMTVEIMAEPAEVSTAPEISTAPPAPRLGEPEAADEAAPPPEPEPPRPVPPPPPPPPAKLEPRPAPRETRQPTPRREVTPPPRRQPERTAPQRPAPPRNATPPRTPPARPAADPQPSGALDGIASSVAREGRGRTPNPPAQQTAAEIRADIRVSINAAVRGPWNACRVTGVDVDRLRTTVVFRLAQSGALDRIVSVATTGANDSNRTQVQRFEECARRAITLAAPFNLPSENYQYWQTYTLDFEKR